MLNKLNILIFLIFTSLQLSGQLNIKIGYGLGYTSGGGYNDLVDDFNLSNEDKLEENLAPMHFMHGVELGIRYRFEKVGLEFTWETLSNDALAVGEDDGSLFSKEIYYSFSSLLLGFESYFGNKGIGLAGGIRSGAFKGDLPAGTDKKKTFVKDSQYVLKAYWMHNIRGGDIIGLSVRPYIMFPLTSFSFKGEGDYLLHEHFEQQTINPEVESAKIPIVGISILFYNGWQNN